MSPTETGTSATRKITSLPTGRQLVRERIGTMVQSTIVTQAPQDPPNVYRYNPTESGGTDAWNYGSTRRWTGSPVLSATGANPLVTELKPLNVLHKSGREMTPIVRCCGEARSERQPRWA
jgi:hypothetical protein